MLFYHISTLEEVCTHRPTYIRRHQIPAKFFIISYWPINAVDQYNVAPSEQHNEKSTRDFQAESEELTRIAL